jgi:HTH-type transcriptional regulator/antitoxin HigA
MAVEAFDVLTYDRLLTEVHPRVPQTEAENERLLAILEGLHDKEHPSPEERELIKLLIVLIEDFEEAHYATRRAQPHEVLREMMRARDVKPKDLYQIFGSKGTTSEVLRGKRAISKSAAKALANYFNLSVELFL